MRFSKMPWTSVGIHLLSFLFCTQLTAQDPPQYGTPFGGVPDAKNAIIYQVNPRAFSSQGNLNGVTARLGDIQDLGVNVIYLMPIYPIGQQWAVNSPYCIKDFKAVASEYGNLDDLRNLVDQAHARGMSVILDFVANHTAWDHPWINNEYWYVKDGNGNIVSANGWSDVAQLDFNNYDMRGAMLDAMRYWLFAANVDGYRFDYVDGPAIDFWQQVLSNMRDIPGRDFLFFAEGDGAHYYNAGFDLTYGMHHFYRIKDIYQQGWGAWGLNESNEEELDGASSDQTVARFLTNHDLNGSDGTPIELFDGNDGAMAGYVASFFQTAVPFIYNGDEEAWNQRIYFPFTDTDIQWGWNQEFRNEFKSLIQFRRQSEAVRLGSLNVYSDDHVCVFERSYGSEQVLVIDNIRNTNKTYWIPAHLQNTLWYDAFTGQTVVIGAAIDLQAYEYRILTNELTVGLSPKRTAERCEAYVTSQSGGLNVAFNDMVSWALYDSTGRVVTTGKGSKSINCLPGVYTISIMIDGEPHTEKILCSY